jgi:predicted DNA-binding transcriptional regulator AlpA
MRQEVYMLTEEKTQRRTVNLEEWAREVGVGRSLAYDLARRNEIPGLLKLGGRYLVSRAAMERMLENGQTPS